MISSIEIKELAGCGGKIIIFTLPFIIIGLFFNILFPDFFYIYGYSRGGALISALIAILGTILWIWATVLIVKKVPKKELVTNGPYRILKHPIYTGVSLFVAPFIGFIFNTWMCLVVGIIAYIFSRIFRGEEEDYLDSSFHHLWQDYKKKVWIKWL